MPDDGGERAARDGERDVVQREGQFVGSVCVLLFVFILLLLLPACLLLLPLRLLLPPPSPAPALTERHAEDEREACEGVARVSDGGEGVWEEDYWLAQELVGVLVGVVKAREGRKEREV